MKILLFIILVAIFTVFVMCLVRAGSYRTPEEDMWELNCQSEAIKEQENKKKHKKERGKICC